MAEMQPDELTVPVEGDVVMDCRLAEDVSDILWKSVKKWLKKTTKTNIQHAVVLSHHSIVFIT